VASLFEPEYRCACTAAPTISCSNHASRIHFVSDLASRFFAVNTSIPWGRFYLVQTGELAALLLVAFRV